MGRAIGYTRVSKEEQAISGLGLEAQEHAIRAYAASVGIAEVLIFPDPGVQSTMDLAEREGLTSALASLVKGDVFVVAKRDRLARDPMLTGMIEHLVSTKKCRVVSVAGEGTADETAASRMFRGMIDLVAMYERLMIGERTKAALAAKKRRGEKIGRPAFGVRIEGTREVAEPAEAAVVREIQELTSTGVSDSEVARRLNARGVVTKTGKAWTHVQVGRALAKFGGAVAAVA